MFRFSKIIKFTQTSLFKLIQTYKGYIRTALLIVILGLFVLSACTPFQLNLPGSCSIFSNPEKPQQQHDKAPVENKKRGIFGK